VALLVVRAGGADGIGGLYPPIAAQGSSISLESKRRILAALAGFRPKFRQIARELTDVDLVFVEEAMERLMLEYDRTLACEFGPRTHADGDLT
jgi:hypothetical protein